LAGWRNHFSQLCFVYGVCDIRQTEKHTAEPLVLDTKAVEYNMAIEIVETHKSAGTDQSTEELMTEGSRKFRF